jgi:glycosyltransferase involved in cell wall biosynthesis
MYLATAYMISVLVPTFNRRSTIGRTIESILGQTYADFELIILDDGSTDGTVDFIREKFNDPRIRIERVEENAGVDATRNRGLEKARGEFVAFLDSDDEWLPHALERAMTAMHDPGIGMVLAPFTTDDGNLTSFDRAEDGEIPFLDILCEKGMRAKKNGFCLLRRSAIGDIRWPTKYLQFIFYRRVAARTRTFFIAEPLGLYHFDASDAYSVSNKRKIPDIALSIERGAVLSDFLDEFGPLLTDHRPLMYSFYAYGAAVGLLLAGKTDRARRLAREAARMQPRIRYVGFWIFSLLPFSSWFLRKGFVFRKSLQRADI